MDIINFDRGAFPAKEYKGTNIAVDKYNADICKRYCGI